MPRRRKSAQDTVRDVIDDAVDRVRSTGRELRVDEVTQDKKSPRKFRIELEEIPGDITGNEQVAIVVTMRTGENVEVSTVADKPWSAKPSVVPFLVEDLAFELTAIVKRLFEWYRENRPKQVYIKTGHWGGRAFPSDAPCRYNGKLSEVSFMRLWSDFEVYDGTWQEAHRINPPKQVAMRVVVEVDGDVEPHEAEQRVRDQLSSRDFRSVSVDGGIEV